MRTTEEKEAVIFLSLSLPPSDLVWESCLPLLSPTPKLDPAPLPSTLFCQSSAHGLGWEWNGVGTMIAQNEKGRQELERPVWGYTSLAPPQRSWGCGEQELQLRHQFQPQPLSPAFQPCCALEPRRGWPPASLSGNVPGKRTLLGVLGRGKRLRTWKQR